MGVATAVARAEWRRRAVAVAWCAALAGCYEASPPPALRRLELTGGPYQRGLQHGQALASEIRSFYTTMLATSLLPYLNREQADIAAVLKAYDPTLHPEYGGGQFSLRLLSESADELEKSIPQDLRDEMHGIAAGAGVPYAHILLLNTFVDSTLTARAITYFLRKLQSPSILFVEFDTSAPNSGPLIESDGVDNDEDGQTDEKNEGRVAYAAWPTASIVEVPPFTKVRLLISDADGVDPKTVRLQLVINGEASLYTPADKALIAQPFVQGNGETSKEIIEVRLTLAAPLPAKAIATLSIQASDNHVVAEPPPAKARTMRIEQLTLSTAGLGKKRGEIPNLGRADGTTQPPSLAFGAAKAATAGGQPVIGHHFSLLDAGTSHKHCVLQIHRPPGKPSFAFAGWAGIVYGFAGVSARGLGVAVTHSDTLNNAMVARFAKELFDAKLVTSGVPVGVAVRQVLETAPTAQAAADALVAMKHGFGWNFLVGDNKGELRAVEVHAAVPEDESKPVAYGPQAVDGDGRPLASATGDDLMIGAHFRKLARDIDATIVFEVPPQRTWSSYYYPSLRAQEALRQALVARHGKLDADAAIALLRAPALVDVHDSMQASVIEPQARRLHVAAGAVPATARPFEVVELPPDPGAP